MEEKLTYYQKNKEKYKEQQRQKIQKKYDGLKEDYDFVVCKICGYKCADLGTHLKSHGINSKEYKEKYGQDSQIKCQKMRDRVRGENNPGFNHGGKLSPFSDKFIHAKDGYKEEVVKKAAKSRKDNNSNTTTLEYWLKKTDDIEEAKKMLFNRQKTFSLDICIEKYGKDEGKKRWLDRQEKWHKNYKKSNFSKISQKLFWLIANKLESLDNIYFAELNEQKIKSKDDKNNEYRLRLDKVVLPDFIDVNSKKIIEFDGEYWHSERNKRYSFNRNYNRDHEKDLIYKQNGYSVLHVKEREFNMNIEETVDRCIKFLRQ